MNGFKQLIPTEKKLYQVEHLFYMLNQNPHIYHVNHGRYVDFGLTCKTHVRLNTAFSQLELIV